MPEETPNTPDMTNWTSLDKLYMSMLERTEDGMAEGIARNRRELKEERDAAAGPDDATADTGGEPGVLPPDKDAG